MKKKNLKSIKEKEFPKKYLECHGLRYELLFLKVRWSLEHWYLGERTRVLIYATGYCPNANLFFRHHLNFVRRARHWKWEKKKHHSLRSDMSVKDGQIARAGDVEQSIQRVGVCITSPRRSALWHKRGKSKVPQRLARSGQRDCYTHYYD